MGHLCTVSIVSNLRVFQKSSFLKKPLGVIPNVPKRFKSNNYSKVYSAFHIILIILSMCSAIGPEGVEQYIQRGNVASKNPSKSLLNLEDLIKGYHESEIYTKLLSTEEYENYGSEKHFFIALALPSMSGKTQMAFNIRSKRPLYFALQYSQLVNDSFSLISTKLRDLLESDYRDAQDILTSEFQEEQVKDQPKLNKKTAVKEANKIITLNHKFKSLGFLVSLVKECEKLYKESTNDEWMKFYAENQKSLSFIEYEPISLAEFEAQKDVYKPFSEKYFFFIDEFDAESGIVMLRNMCRYLKIPCVLASTDTEVINIIGISMNDGSGSSPPSVFCAVFPKLSTLSNEEIDQFFNEEINCESFLELARNVSEHEERRMSLLLQFFKDQAKKTRPGVSLFLFKALKEISEWFPESGSLKVDTLFQEVIRSMVVFIKNRKGNAFESLEGMRANAVLLGGNEFESKYEMSDKYENNESSLIDKHFFYLKNPRTNSEAEEPYLLFQNDTPYPKLISQPNSENRYEIQGFFDENEELLKLVCLVGPMDSTSYGIVYPPYGRFHLTADTDKVLEFITYNAFLKSSHFNDEKAVSLEGVNIKIFLKNLLASFDGQMLNFVAYRKYVKLNYENVKDDQILAETVVPCLYIANNDWPAEIKAIFDPKESSVKLGKYTRKTNDSEIDATIDLIDKDGRSHLGVIECKNRETPINNTDYKIIIEKAIKYAKIKRIEDFLNNLRPIVKTDMIESFEKFIKSDLKDPKFASENEEKSRRSFKALIENFEDLSKFQVVRNKLENFVKEENLNEFENLLKDLDGLKSACPLVHFLICKSCKSLKSLGEGTNDRKINFFRFVKDTKEYKIIKATDPIHKDPDMVAFIIETNIINNKKR
jgi:hypothetical protein